MRVYVDTETCGFVKGSSGVCEVAASVWIDGDEKASFSSLANPGDVYLESTRFKEAQSTHRISRSAILESPPAEKVASALYHFIQKEAEGASLHSFNVQFDSRHLAEKPWLIPRHWWGRCVMLEAQKAMKKKRFPSLMEAARFCGYDEYITEHRALSDARMAALIDHWLLRAGA